jgi:hypothetical protein
MNLHTNLKVTRCVQGDNPFASDYSEATLERLAGTMFGMKHQRHQHIVTLPVFDT